MSHPPPNERPKSGEGACIGKENEGEEEKQEEVTEDREEEDVPFAVCGKLGDDDKALLCEGYDRSYQTFFLDPPLNRIPGGDWFCPG